MSQWKDGDATHGRNVRWTVRLEVIAANGKPFETFELVTIVRVLGHADSSDFDLSLSEGKAILEQVQARITQNRVDQMAGRNRFCAGCGELLLGDRRGSGERRAIAFHEAGHAVIARRLGLRIKTVSIRRRGHRDPLLGIDLDCGGYSDRGHRRAEKMMTLPPQFNPS
jgi:hypothetical protein